MSAIDEDADALVRAAKTEREALGRLYDRYYPAVQRFCQRRLFGTDGADDATAETFLAVARGIVEFPGATDDDFRRWVFRIAVNAANLQARKTERRREAATDDRKLADPRGSASEIEIADDFRAVAAALARLDERSRTVVTLRYMEGMEHEQIAAVVELRPAAVRTVLSRALARLREWLGVERICVAERREGSP